MLIQQTFLYGWDFWRQCNGVSEEAENHFPEEEKIRKIDYETIKKNCVSALAKNWRQKSKVRQHKNKKVRYEKLSNRMKKILKWYAEESKTKN